MAVTHTTAIRNGIADYVVDQIDTGSSASTGKCIFLTSGAVAVATLPFSNPAFGSASSGSATAAAITSDTNAAGGTIASWKWVNRDGTSIVLGAAGTSGSDINLSSLTVSAGDTLSLASLVYTACP